MKPHVPKKIEMASMEKLALAGVVACMLTGCGTTWVNVRQDLAFKPREHKIQKTVALYVASDSRDFVSEDWTPRGTFAFEFGSSIIPNASQALSKIFQRVVVVDRNDERSLKASGADYLIELKFNDDTRVHVDGPILTFLGLRLGVHKVTVSIKCIGTQAKDGTVVLQKDVKVYKRKRPSYWFVPLYDSILTWGHCDHALQSVSDKAVQDALEKINDLILPVFVEVDRLAELEAERAWATAKAANTIPALSDFITEFSSSHCAPEARLALESLEEERDWASAKKTPTGAAFAEFIERHPSSDYVAEASKELAKIGEAWPGTIPSSVPESLRPLARQAFASGKKCFIWQDESTKASLSYRRFPDSSVFITGVSAIAAPEYDGMTFSTYFLFFIKHENGSIEERCGITSQGNTKISSKLNTLIDIPLGNMSGESWSGELNATVFLSTPDTPDYRTFKQKRVISISNTILVKINLP